MGQLGAAAGGAVKLSDEHAGAGAAAPSAPAPNRVIATWVGDHRFDAGRPGGPTARIDSDTRTGQSPVDALLSALGTCTAVDVVDILKKRRTPVSALQVEVVARRVTTTPRRLSSVLLRYHITGDGIERDQALRAIELAVTKYCSVRDSLREDIDVKWELELG
jgi:putative redox protein